MQFAGEPANCVRLHGIGRNDLVLYAVALGTFELAMLKTHGTRANARKHHARRAVRTSRALNWNEGWAGGKIGLWHDTSLHLGGSVQHSLSPIDAEGGAAMEPGCRNGLPAGGQYCSHSKRIYGWSVNQDTHKFKLGQLRTKTDSVRLSVLKMHNAAQLNNA